MPGAVSRAGIERMADDAIVFAMANPTPEIAPEDLPPGKVAVVATGRSDYPNQINNVLAFPGVFRGALDVRASTITEGMKVAAGQALAAVIADDELGPEYVIPSVFNRDVAPAVAAAVAEAAERRRRRADAPASRSSCSCRCERAAAPVTRNAALRADRACAARRAGKIAATIPTTIAAIANTITCVVGNAKTMKSTRDDQEAAEHEPEDDPDHGADQCRDHALVPDHAADLPPGHSDRAQHADLARPLEHGQHERVDDAEEADDDRERKQDVENVENRA